MDKQKLDMPCVILDLDKVERNIAVMQQIATQAGISLRPHAKTHKIPGEDSPLGMGRGLVIGHPGFKIAWLTEEHGMRELSKEEEGLEIGDALEIIPVHCCAVVNMVDEVAAVRGSQVEAIWPVIGRSKSR